MELSPDVTRNRRRSMAALFSGVALVNVAVSGSSTAATLVGTGVLGEAWSGVPSAVSVLGTAAGAFLLSRLMARRGRRVGIWVGYTTAIVGAAICAGALARGLPPLFFSAVALVGAGNGAAQLSRYAAADLYPAQRRGWALSMIVWSGALGGIVGPGLLAPSAAAATGLRLPHLAGAFLVGALAFAVALGVSLLLPRRHTPAVPTSPVARGAGWSALRLPAVSVAVVAMVAGQFDMTAVMTMTPVAMTDQGMGLAMVGGILSVHIAGMFVLSPVSGKLADRFGGATVISGGAATLFLAALLTVLAGRVGFLIAPGLFLLGYGWNLCFVGASTLLSIHVPASEQARTQGSVDTVVWIAAALASLGSGGGLAFAGYGGLAIGAAAITALPLTIVLAVRHGTIAAARSRDALDEADGQAGRLVLGGRGPEPASEHRRVDGDREPASAGPDTSHLEKIRS